jgi:voltage-gated potassium channel
LLKRRIYEFLELSIPGDRFGFVFDRFMMILIALNVFAIVLETVPSIHAAYTGFFFGFEIFSVAIFTIEYIMRLWSCTENKVGGYTHPILGRIKFMFSPMAIIDLIAFLPFYLSAFFAIDLRLLRIFRLLRLLKLTRYSPALMVIWAVIRNQSRALTAAFFVMLTALLFTSSIILLFEHKVQPENFASIPHSMWWSLATLTTVGYGDVVPITIGGKIFGGLTMVLAIGMLALPTGVIATGFANEIRKHEFIVTWRLIAKVPLFSNLDAAQIADIAGMLTPLVVPPRHAVVRLGEQADSMFFIISGEVEVEIMPNPSKLGEGDFFGEIGILRNSVRMADVVSLTDCQLLELTKENFHELITNHPDLGDHVREVMHSRMAGRVDVTTGPVAPT